MVGAQGADRTSDRAAHGAGRAIRLDAARAKQVATGNTGHAESFFDKRITAAHLIRPPQLQTEAERELARAEAALTKAEADLLQSLLDRGAPPAHVKYLKAMFRNSRNRAPH